MFHNQNGFTYPVTLCMIILLGSILVVSTDQFLNEKRILKETETILKQDYYLLSTMDRLQFDLSTNEHGATEGTFEFKDGQARYQIVNITEDLLEIMITIKVGDGDTIFNGSAIYDLNLKRMIKWEEVN